MNAELQELIAAAQDWVDHVVVPRNAPVTRSRRLVEAVRAYNAHPPTQEHT